MRTRSSSKPSRASSGCHSCSRRSARAARTRTLPSVPGRWLVGRAGRGRGRLRRYIGPPAKKRKAEPPGESGGRPVGEVRIARQDEVSGQGDVTLGVGEAPGSESHVALMVRSRRPEAEKRTEVIQRFLAYGLL